VPSLLHSRGLLAGAGSAASLIAAAFVSLLFATGLVAFTSWPAAGGSSVPSVSLPAAPAAGGVPTGAAGRASAAISAGQAIVLPAAGAPPRRGTARTIARTGGRGGSTSAPTPAANTPPAAGSSSSEGSAPPASRPTPPGVTRQVTNGLADTTSNVTHQVGSTVGGPVGGAVQQTGDQVAETVREIGDATAPVLGALGG
jgi:hypothetical protein